MGRHGQRQRDVYELTRQVDGRIFIKTYNPRAPSAPPDRAKPAGLGEGRRLVACW